MTSDLSVVCSAATNANHSFASTAYIAPRHQAMEQEMAHDLLQTVQYRNYMTNGRIARPFGGLAAPDSIKVLRRLAHHERQTFERGALQCSFAERDIASGFKSEQIIPVNRGLPEDKDGPLPREGLSFLSGLESLQHRNSFLYVCMSTPPLIPLERHHVEQYRNGISRGKIHLVLDLIVPEIRLEVLQLMHLFLNLHVDVGDRASSLFAHRSDAGRIFYDIWRKWDFEQDCPLLPGVERNDYGDVVWKKTGLPYIP